MSQPFLGQICTFGFNFAPRNWALCDGQLMSIAQNTALFSLLGTQFGGNGQTTFALPNLQSRVAIHQGQGPGLSPYVIGQESGTETVTLLQTNMPIHNHLVGANGTDSNPNAAKSPLNNFPGYSDSAPLWATASNGTMSPLTVGLAGGNLPFGILPPYLTINFCIALNGIFPSRN